MRHKVAFYERESFGEVISDIDTIYQTRIQKERFAEETEYLKFKGIYILNAANTSGMKAGAVILHPLPRVDEISTELDYLPKAAYFRQVKYGLLVRMALLMQILDK